MKKTTPSGHMAEADVIMMIMAIFMIIRTEKKTPKSQTRLLVMFIFLRHWYIGNHSTTKYFHKFIENDDRNDMLGINHVEMP